MDKDRGLEVLKDVIKNNITHKDYDRVVKLADLYYKMVTGDGVDKLLRRIIKRETEEEFQQRADITSSVIPAILNSTKLPFQKATRKQPIVRRIDYESDADAKKVRLEKFISKYWGEKSLEEYMEYAFVDYNYVDPNAFLITEFESFNPLVENAEPYPFIATSEEAIMYEYFNENLEYLIVRLPITYINKKSPQPGFKFTIYLGQDTIVLSQVSEEHKQNEDVIDIANKYYQLFYYEPKDDKVPAIRFGYIRDGETKGRSFVSVFHAVLPYLNKSMKIDSELDLSTAMVAFPQRFMYVSPCKEPDCRSGTLLDGRTCTICGGTGHEPFHRGTMDIITFDLPKRLSDTEDRELVDLDKMLVYKGPPIDLLTFQKDYIEYLKKSIHAMMFNADLFTRAEVSVTATEKILETDNMNDTLYPFARNYSSLWEFVVRDIATFTDLSEGLEVHHKFPNDFKFKSIIELMNELKTAKDAGASPATVAAIEDDINKILYADRPDDLKKIEIKSLINPFSGHSEANVRLIISQGKTTKYNETLWANEESIFNELELEVPNLYQDNISKIIALVKAKVEEYMAQIEGEIPEEPVNPFQ